MPAPKSKSKKRSPPSEDLSSSSSKRTQTRSSPQAPVIPPTPGNSTRSHSVQVGDGESLNPACPSIIRDRDQSALSKLPRDSDILDTFARLKADNDLSDEETLLKFITSYDVPLSTLNQISFSRLPASFSNVKYKEVAPYVWLDPSVEGSDILPLKAFRSRIPTDLFGDICMDVGIAMEQYGRLEDHGNEEVRSRLITSLFSRIVSLFGHAVTNNPEGLLESEFAKKGRIEHHFIVVKSRKPCL
jgi:hypothetical protein